MGSVRDWQRYARKGTTTQRGYGWTHASERKRRVAVHRPGNPCAIGGEALWQPAGMLDLAHDHVNGGYLPGLACRRHNRQEGAVRGNQMRGLARRWAQARRW